MALDNYEVISKEDILINLDAEEQVTLLLCPVINKLYSFVHIKSILKNPYNEIRLLKCFIFYSTCLWLRLKIRSELIEGV